MLDLKFVTLNKELIKENCRKRGLQIDVDLLVELVKERSKIKTRIDELRRQMNELAQSVQGAELQEERRNRARELKLEEKELAQQLDEISNKVDKIANTLPNILDERVPVGGEENNLILRKVGEPKKFDFTVRTHDEIGLKTGIIDIQRGVKLAKSRFYCLKNEAVMLRIALIRMFSKHLKEQGFQLVAPPVLAKERTLFTSGYLPFAEKDNFVISGEDLSLIGTSEQSLLGMHMDEILTKLPVLYLGDSLCFRTEVGSAGRDVHGIFRVHQFYKLEQIVLCHPDEAEYWHLKCLENEEWLLKELKIPYQVVLTASKDLSPAGKIKYDIEAWFPGQNRYREVTSNTNLGDFQTRRGNIRFKIDGQKGYPHSISATGFCDRHILAILENYQQKDGSVRIPEKLVPFMDGIETIPALERM